MENWKYFLHDVYMRSSAEMLAVRRKFWNQGYAVYNMILEYLSASKKGEIELSKINVEILAGDFMIEESLLVDIINYLIVIGFFAKEENILKIENIKTKTVKEKKNSQKEKKNDEYELIKTEILSEILADELIVWLNKKNFFERFWSIYPVKKSKKKCLEKLEKLDLDLQEMVKILEAVELQKMERKILQKKKDQWDYTIHIAPWKYPITRINQECWDDDIQFRDRAIYMISKINGKQNIKIKKEEIKNPITKEQLESLNEKKRKLFKN